MALVVLGLVSFVAWFFSMLAGGGSPLVLIPLVTLLLDSQSVAPVITVGMLVGSGQRSLFFWEHIDWWVTLWYVPGAIAGAILGAYAFTQFRADWLQIVVAIGLLLMVVNYWLRREAQPFKVKTWYFMPVSFVNAFCSTLIGSTGPVMNPLYLNYGLEKEHMIATKACNKVILHTVKLLSYLALGALNGKVMVYGLVIGLGAVPANWLGKWVLERMTGEQFRHAVFTFVAVSGVLMLWEQREFIWLW